MTVVERLIEQLLAGTPDPDMCPATAVVWHNTDEIVRPLSESFAAMRLMRATVPSVSFDDVRSTETDGGDTSVARYVITAVLPSGGRLRVPGCLVVQARRGVIERCEEYLDSAQTSALSAVLAGATDPADGTATADADPVQP